MLNSHCSLRFNIAFQFKVITLKKKENKNTSMTSWCNSMMKEPWIGERSANRLNSDLRIAPFVRMVWYHLAAISCQLFQEPKTTWLWNRVSRFISRPFVCPLSSNHGWIDRSLSNWDRNGMLLVCSSWNKQSYCQQGSTPSNPAPYFYFIFF